MTREEFLSAMKNNGAIFAPAVTMGDIVLTNTALQQIRSAMLPQFAIDLYKTTGGIILGNGYIFGPHELQNGGQYPAPPITKINDEISGMGQITGHTVFGRNDLFWFSFDAFGTCYMHDNLTLQKLRKYDDPYRAMYDCLIAGKI